MLYRHGDVLIQKVAKMPGEAKKQKHLILAEGEMTGHSHRIAEKGVATLYKEDSQLFLEVTGTFATVVHEEHASIKLPGGCYRVWQQREYTPERIVTVRD